jgi:LacI family transcriptional regulator of maltose regulon
VNEAVEQLGFVRNRQASALRGGQSGVIGLIVRDLTSPFYAELTAGLTEALEAQGRMVFLLHGGREADQLLSRLDMLLNQGVDGVIVAGASGGQRAVRACRRKRRAAGVCFARQLPRRSRYAAPG